MSREAKDTRGTARCDQCIFGRRVEVVDTDKKGRELARREVYECHVSRPTANRGFPVVRPDDYCSYHVDAQTLERTFAGMGVANQVAVI